MAALCLTRALWRSAGSAELLICTDLGSLPCSCSASMSMILPFLMVTRTWALPYCVLMASPVTVLVPDAVEPDGEPEPEPEPDAEPDPDALGDPDVAGADATAEAVGRAGSRGLKLSTAAAPATVAVRTMGARRMVSLEGEGLVVQV